MVTIAEIEERIVELHKARKTFKEISKDVHKNYSFIGAVLKERFPEEYSESHALSKETQALELFSLKKTPTQVAIELNESPDSVERYYNDFWRLERMHSLYNIYRENKKAIPNLLRLNKLLKKKDISPRMYDQVFDFVEREMIRKDDTVSWSNEHVYSAEELERAFTDHST